VDVAEEIGGEFVVAGGEASAVLEAAEHPLDGVAALMEGLAEAAFPAPVALGRDVGKRALLLDQVTDAIAVISTKGERSAVAIGNGVDLGVASAPADADRRACAPLFRPPPSGAPSHACCGLFGNKGCNRAHCPTLNQTHPPSRSLHHWKA
jgi:hypothetical protein